MDQPDALARGTPHPLPPVGFQKLAQGCQSDDLDKLPVLFPQRSHLLNQQRKKIQLKVLPHVLKSDCLHEILTPTAPVCLKKQKTILGVLQSAPGTRFFIGKTSYYEQNKPVIAGILIIAGATQSIAGFGPNSFSSSL